MILISPTAFKGTLSPWQAALAMQAALKKARIRESTLLLPLADGGDGTLEVLMTPLRGRLKWKLVRGPLGRPTQARWGFIAQSPFFRGRTAILEMAEASGLKLLPGKNKILQASTFGTGELMKAALDHGCRTILMGVGGTATADGGAGALQALGLKFYDAEGRSLNGTPEDLIRLRAVDSTRLDPRLKGTRIFVLCDVTNPLLGRHGSARTFGPQKGATPSQVEFLERVMRHWARFANRNVKSQPGTGAAGALAFGLAGFLGARLVQGTPFIMQKLNWPALAKKARWILTGEGRLDATSFSGKVVGEICRRKHLAKIAVLCGSTRLSSRFLRRKGVDILGLMGEEGKTKPQRQIMRETRRIVESREWCSDRNGGRQAAR